MGRRRARPSVDSMPSENAFTLGGSLGYTFRPRPRPSLMPEVAVMMSLGPLPRTSGARLAGASGHVQFDLAFMVDSAGGE